MKIKNQKIDLIADLDFYTIDEGGRKSPFHTQYKPATKFEGIEFITSGQQTFIDREIVNSGESVRANIKILSSNFFTGKLSSGQNFIFFEQPDKPLGKGRIIEIINKDLEAIKTK